MRLGRIMLMQLSINWRIRHCRVCCLVPWAATQSSRARATTTSPHVQHHANEATRFVQDRTHASFVKRYFVLFYFVANGRTALHSTEATKNSDRKQSLVDSRSVTFAWSNAQDQEKCALIARTGLRLHSHNCPISKYMKTLRNGHLSKFW